MQVTELLPDIGRPVAYYPALAHALGSVNAAILLCQLIYWLGKEAHPELGIYKTKAELTAETGLSEDEQDIASAKLKQLGLLTTHYQRLQHRLYYLVQANALCALWERHQSCTNPENQGSGTPKTRVREPGFSGFGNPENQGSGTPKTRVRSLLTQETTPEITSGEHTQEMVQASVLLTAVLDGLDGWLKREAR